MLGLSPSIKSVNRNTYQFIFRAVFHIYQLSMGGSKRQPCLVIKDFLKGVQFTNEEQLVEDFI